MENEQNQTQDVNYGETPENVNQLEDEAQYMSEPTVDDAATQEMKYSNSTEKMKMLHLFELVQTLLDYAKIFGSNLEIIDMNRIDEKDVTKLKMLKDKFDLYSKKLNNFISEVFVTEPYEKNLYIYLTLRQELLVMTKYLRQLLKLETLIVDEKQKDK